TRRRRKHGIEAMAQQLPLKAFVFDILYKDGASLLDIPLVERLKILEETLQPDDILMRTASHTVSDAHTLTLLFDEAVSLGLEVDHKPARVSSLIEPSVWVEPRIVIEVLADEITRSPTHTAGKVGAEPGYALRFPRLVSFRERDKQPEDATTVQELIELYNSQGKR